MRLQEFKVTENRNQPNRPNNVKKIFHYMGWDTKHRGFIDAMKHGYRVHLGDWSDEETQSLANDIEQNLGITGLVFRKRGGYSRRSGEVDMVVPFYFGDDEPISW